MNTLQQIPSEAWAALITAVITVVLSWMDKQGYKIPALSALLKVGTGGAAPAEPVAADAEPVTGDKAPAFTITLSADQVAALLLAQHGQAKPAG